MVVRVIVVDLGAGQWGKKMSFWSCWEKKCRGYIIDAGERLLICGDLN